MWASTDVHSNSSLYTKSGPHKNRSGTQRQVARTSGHFLNTYDTQKITLGCICDFECFTNLLADGSSLSGFPQVERMSHRNTSCQHPRSRIEFRHGTVDIVRGTTYITSDL